MSPWKPWRLGVSRRLGYRDPVRQTFGYGPQYGEHSLNGYPLGCLPAAGSVPYAGERMTKPSRLPSRGNFGSLKRIPHVAV